MTVLPIYAGMSMPFCKIMACTASIIKFSLLVHNLNASNLYLIQEENRCILNWIQSLQVRKGSVRYYNQILNSKVIVPIIIIIMEHIIITFTISSCQQIHFIP